MLASPTSLQLVSCRVCHFWSNAKRDFHWDLTWLASWIWVNRFVRFDTKEHWVKSSTVALASSASNQLVSCHIVVTCDLKQRKILIGILRDWVLWFSVNQLVLFDMKEQQEKMKTVMLASPFSRQLVSCCVLVIWKQNGRRLLDLDLCVLNPKEKKKKRRPDW